MTPAEDEAEARARDERETKAIDLAVKQARQDERIKARLDGHQAEIALLRQAVAGQATAVEGVVKQLTAIEKALASNAAVAAAGLSNRTFMVGVLMLISAIAAIFFGTSGVIH
jgi:hypothetical protein